MAFLPLPIGPAFQPLSQRSLVRAVLRSFLAAAVVAVTTAAVLFAAPAAGGVVISGTGLSGGSAAVPLAARAEFTLSEKTLTIVLSNTSPDASSQADQLLSSFYFDILKDGKRPGLTMTSASGLVWQVRSKLPDLPINYTPPKVAGGSGTYVLADGDPTAHLPSNLLADKDNDRTWQFRGMNPAAAPFLGFGIGTVGNGGYGGDEGNGFTPAFVVGTGQGLGPVAIAFSIFKNGDIQPVGAPVQNQYLVHGSATFTFTAPELAHFTEADIAPHVVFGFGTGPDVIIAVPEPTTLAGAAAAPGLAWFARRRWRGRAGMRRARSVH